MRKTTVIGMLALMIVGVMLSAGVVSAYRGDYSETGPNYNEERHELMEDAFDTDDYDVWYAMMTEDDRHPRVVDVITEGNFHQFVEAHEAGKSGDSSAAAELRAELGLNNGNGPKDGSGFGKGMGQGKGQGQGQKMQQNSFVDADGDSAYNNMGTGQSLGKLRR